MVTVKNTNEAMMAVRELNYEDDGDILFSAPQKPPKPAVAAKFGAVPNLKGTTLDGIVCIAIPLTYLAEHLTAGNDSDRKIAKWIADGAPELDAMSKDLDELRAGTVQPLATMTLDQAAEVAAEWIGQYEFEHRAEW